LSGELLTPVALHTQQNTGAHLIGGLVGSRAGMDVSEKRNLLAGVEDMLKKVPRKFFLRDSVLRSNKLQKRSEDSC